MTVLFRCRVEKPILEKADKVAAKLDPTCNESVILPWEQRAAKLDSFHDKSKAW